VGWWLYRKQKDSEKMVGMNHRKVILLWIVMVVGICVNQQMLHAWRCGMHDITPMEYYEEASLIIEAEYLESTDIRGINVYAVNKVLKGKFEEEKILLKMSDYDDNPHFMNPILIAPHKYGGWYDVLLVENSKYASIPLFHRGRYAEKKKSAIEWLIDYFGGNAEERDAIVQMSLASDDEYIRRYASDFYWSKLRDMKEVRKDSLYLSLMMKTDNEILEDSILSWFSKNPYSLSKKELLRRYDAAPFREKRKYCPALKLLVDSTDAERIFSIANEQPIWNKDYDLLWEALPESKREGIFAYLLDSTIAEMDSCYDLRELNDFFNIVTPVKTELLKNLLNDKRFENCKKRLIYHMVIDGEPSALEFAIKYSKQDTSTYGSSFFSQIFRSCSIEILLHFAQTHEEIPRYFLTRYLEKIFCDLYTKRRDLPPELHPYVERVLDICPERDIFLYLINDEKAGVFLHDAFTKTGDWRYVMALYENGNDLLADSLIEFLDENDRIQILFRRFPHLSNLEMEELLHSLWFPYGTITHHIESILEKNKGVSDSLKVQLDCILSLNYKEFISHKLPEERYYFCTDIIEFDSLCFPLTGTLFLLTKDGDPAVQFWAKRRLKSRKIADVFLDKLKVKEEEIGTLVPPESLRLEVDSLRNPIAFSWKDVAGATHYQIQIDSSESLNTAEAIVFKAESSNPRIDFRDSWSKFFSPKIYWRVRAIGKRRLSEWSSVISQCKTK
jgi:hypothetical protein